MTKPCSVYIALASLVLGALLFLATQHFSGTSTDAQPQPDTDMLILPIAEAPSARQRSAADSSRAAAPMSGSAASDHDLSGMLEKSDAADRELLAGLEHQTAQTPPSGLLGLIRKRRDGATREQLAQLIDQELDQRMSVRVAARRWLRTVRPVAAAAPGQQVNPSAPTLGTGIRRVRVLTPVHAASPE